jgi:hypothetical protein
MTDIGRPLTVAMDAVESGRAPPLWPKHRKRAEFIIGRGLTDLLLSSWKYESGFLTIFHAGKSYELGYVKLHEDARSAAVAFGEARRSTMRRPRRIVRGVRRSKTPHLLQGGPHVGPS